MRQGSSDHFRNENCKLACSLCKRNLRKRKTSIQSRIWLARFRAFAAANKGRQQTSHRMFRSAKLSGVELLYSLPSAEVDKARFD